MALDTSTVLGDGLLTRAPICLYLCRCCETSFTPVESMVCTECLQMIIDADRRLCFARGCFLNVATGLPLSITLIIDSFLNRYLF